MLYQKAIFLYIWGVKIDSEVTILIIRKLIYTFHKNCQIESRYFLP